jgi:hypothetical protein
MKLTALFGLIAISCLAGSARAQQGRVTININNPLWVVVQDLNEAHDSQFVDLTGSGNDVLHVNGFVDIGKSASIVNRAQSNVQGIRTGATPLSGSASASIGAPGGFMQIAWTGAGNRTASVTGQVTPTGVLPAHQSVNMTGNSSMTINFGIVAGATDTRTSTASVVPPSCSGKICSVYNRLILNSSPAINATITATPAFPTFFYSQQGSASASCTLHVGDSAFEDTDVFTDFTANLN